MNTVFVEAVKKNQIGVRRRRRCSSRRRREQFQRMCGRRTFLSSPMRPWSSPEQRRRRPPQAKPPRRRWRSRRPRSNSGGLFGSLFASKSADATPADAQPEKSEGTFDRMKRLVGLRSADKAKTAAAAPAPATKPKPATPAGPARVAWRDPAKICRGPAGQRQPTDKLRQRYGRQPRRRSPRRSPTAPR